VDFREELGEATSGGGLGGVGEQWGDGERDDPVGSRLDRVDGIEGAGEIDELGEEGGPGGGVLVAPGFWSQGEATAEGGRGPTGVEGAGGDFLDIRADMPEGVWQEVRNGREIDGAEGTEADPFAAELMEGFG
jgi:hypothetical protein